MEGFVLPHIVYWSFKAGKHRFNARESDGIGEWKDLYGIKNEAQNCQTILYFVY